MKIIYDPDVDVLQIIFSDTPVEESNEDKPGINRDRDTSHLAHLYGGRHSSH